MISFRKADDFNNLTIPFSINIERTIVSPLGNYLLRINTTTLTLFNLKQKQQIPIRVSTKIRKAAFSIDEKQIIFTNLSSISSYSIADSTESAIIPQNTWNNITDFQFSYNHALLYYINRSQIYQLNFISKQILAVSPTQGICRPITLSLDYKARILLTSTLSKSQASCFICKWNISNHRFALLQSQNVSKCLINDINIYGEQIVLTKASYNIGKENTVILDYESLAQIGRTSEQINNNVAFIVPFHNYYLQYFSLTNTIYIYKDSLTNTPSTLQYFQIKSIQYNPFQQNIYIISQKNRNNYSNIQILVPVYDCSQVKGAIVDASMPFEQNCKCEQGLIFNKQQLSCQKTTCACQFGTICNSFNLKCQLNCLFINNTLPSLPYHSTECLCKAPFVWSYEYRGCLGVDCGLIQYSQTKDTLKSCICRRGYFWDSNAALCKSNSTDVANNFNSQSSSPGPIIAIIIILSLCLILTIILYYYKKCRKPSQQQSEGKEEGQGKELEAQGPTERKFTQQGRGLPTNIASNQHLINKEINQEINSEGIQNFSIVQDQQKQGDVNFDALKSNMNNPLVL